MSLLKSLRLLVLTLALPGSSALAEVVNATFNSATDTAVSAAGYTATGNSVNLTLNFAPPVGTNLTVVNNTALPFIQGNFSNLIQGQRVALTYNGTGYNFVANYYGGDGNDLVLQWANNRAVAWGDYWPGVLGDGTSTTRLVPTAVKSTGILAGKTIIAVSAGNDHSLALCSDGTLAAWGGNGSGELGNNSTQSSNVPTAVDRSGVLAGKTVIAISAGNSFNLALCSDGAIAAWGSGASGQLGNNLPASSLVPVLVSNSGALAGKSVVKISAGGNHGLALCSDGTLMAWGVNTNGQFGNNSTTNSLVPVVVPLAGALSGKTITSISAGGNYSLACASGTAVAWGNNGFYGQLGNGSMNTISLIPVNVVASGILSGKTVLRVKAGLSDSYNHSLAICSDGTLATWGNNSTGQLGNSSTTESSVPVLPYISAALAGKTLVSATTGSSFTIAQCSDGSLVSWGYNGSGQLGINSTASAYAAVGVNTSTLASGEQFALGNGTVSPGSGHTLALVNSPAWPRADTTAATSLTSGSGTMNGIVNANANSTTVTFEYGLTTSYGSTATASQSPLNGDADTAVSATLTGLVSGNTYHYRVKAVNALGTTYGVDMTFIAASTNVNLSSLSTGTGSLSPSFSSTITDYTVSVSNTTTSITVRPTLADTAATVRVNGVIVTSGNSSSAINLAIGPNPISVVVTAQDGISTKTYNLVVTRQSANADLASLVTTAGAISPAFDPATLNYTLNVPYEVNGIRITPTLADATATVKVNTVAVVSGTPSSTINLSVGSNTITTVVTAQSANTKTYTLTVTRSPLVTAYQSAADVPATVGSLTATGNTANLSLNFAPATGTNLTVVKNTGLGPITGTFSNLAQGQVISMTYGGVVYQFVANYYGGTGNDLVLQWANTRLLAWGSNGSGQLGDDSVTDHATPAAVTRTGVLAGKVITAMAAGSNHSVALCSDSTVATWGYNGYGQLGNATTTDSLVPVAVSATGALSGKTVVAIAAGQFHTLALCSDGTLAAWGYNFYGQLGNGLTAQSSTPVAVIKTGVLSGKTITGIAAGTYHSFALCSDGTLAAWGYNGNGELGNGGTGFSPLPVAVDTSGVLAGKTISAVAAGSFHNFALCTDGTLAGWGYNGFGQLGNNSTASSSVPVLVDDSGALAGKTITTAAAGYYHSTALCADGTLVAWGYNGDGELGNGSNVDSSVPVLAGASGILTGKTVAGLSAGAMHSLVSCADGTFVAWGYNGDGELGNGALVSSNVPVAVSAAALNAGEFFTGGKSGSTALHSLALVASPPPPIVTTLAASSITATSAVLNGSINANGTSTTPSFDHGLTTAYGATLAGTPSAITGSSVTPVSALLTGLSPGTTYHYRLNGVSTGGTTRSADVIFTTDGFNANLASLTLSAGTLSPVFASATTGYTASVSSSTTTLTVTPTVATPSSTVKVNGASVASGAASMPVFLMPGSNTITIVVTAQDGTTTRSYTVNVTRLSAAPEIAVMQSGADIVDGGSKSFGFASGGRSSLTFIIKNTGNADLTGMGLSIDGTDAAMFSVAALPVAPVAGPSGSTTFTVNFAPTSSGDKTAALHIASNDSDESPYDITLTGTGLSATQDTDGDGLNDAAEFQMEVLGFDWQTSQPALVSNYFANAETSGLYTASQVHALHAGTPMLAKDPATGLFKLTIAVLKSADLVNFNALPMTSPQTSINAKGELEFQFSSPDKAAFFRIESK
jgi:alpha-tubulin suppressor-like RCC1 family protein